MNLRGSYSPITYPACFDRGLCLEIVCRLPIFGPHDPFTGRLQLAGSGGSACKSELDECNGKFLANGSYAYFLSPVFPFLPPCLRGEELGTLTQTARAELAQCPLRGTAPMTVAETLECKTIPQFIFVPVGEDLPPDIRERWLVSSAIIGVVWVIIGIWLTNDLKPWLVKGRQIYHWTPQSIGKVVGQPVPEHILNAMLEELRIVSWSELKRKNMCGSMSDKDADQVCQMIARRFDRAAKTHACRAQAIESTLSRDQVPRFVEPIPHAHEFWFGRRIFSARHLFHHDLNSIMLVPDKLKKDVILREQHMWVRLGGPTARHPHETEGLCGTAAFDGVAQSKEMLDSGVPVKAAGWKGCGVLHLADENGTEAPSKCMPRVCEGAGAGPAAQLQETDSGAFVECLVSLHKGWHSAFIAFDSLSDDPGYFERRLSRPTRGEKESAELESDSTVEQDGAACSFRKELLPRAEMGLKHETGGGVSSCGSHPLLPCSGVMAPGKASSEKEQLTFQHSTPLALFSEHVAVRSERNPPNPLDTGSASMSEGDLNHSPTHSSSDDRVVGSERVLAHAAPASIDALPANTGYASEESDDAKYASCIRPSGPVMWEGASRPIQGADYETRASRESSGRPHGAGNGRRAERGARQARADSPPLPPHPPPSPPPSSRPATGAVCTSHEPKTDTGDRTSMSTISLVGEDEGTRARANMHSTASQPPVLSTGNPSEIKIIGDIVYSVQGIHTDVWREAASQSQDQTASGPLHAEDAAGACSAALDEIETGDDAIETDEVEDELNGDGLAHEGVVFKRGQLNRRWLKRYFVLNENGVVLYYKDKSAKEAGEIEQGWLSCQHLTVSVPQQLHFGASFLRRRLEFVVTDAQGKRVECYVDTEEERDRWVRKLQEAARRFESMELKEREFVHNCIVMPTQGMTYEMLGGDSDQGFFLCMRDATGSSMTCRVPSAHDQAAWAAALDKLCVHDTEITAQDVHQVDPKICLDD